MRKIIATTLFATGLLAGPAAAQPALETDTCSVTFLRAPGDVRLVIERWVEAEPRCVGNIRLRVIPTEGGFYLMAQRPDGRLHERIVPDADSAGVVVASWVADDWTAPPEPARPPPPTPIIAVPETALLRAPQAVAARAQVTRSGPARWLGLGAMVQSSGGGGGGVRAEVDLLGAGSWSFGAALSLSASATELSSTNLGYLHTEDYKAVAYLGYTLASGRWAVRPALGIGVVYTDAHTEMLNTAGVWGYETYAADGTFRTIEGSLTVSRALGDRWGLSFGPIATWSEQTLSPGQPDSTIQRSGLDIMWLGAARRRM